MRVALYARVSTDMQAEEGLSISAQLNEMREFADRRGWKIVGEFADPGFSGSSMNRPGLQALRAGERFSKDTVWQISRRKSPSPQWMSKVASTTSDLQN